MSSCAHCAKGPAHHSNGAGRHARGESGEHLEANFAPQFERLDEPFEVAEGVVIPPGEYRFDRYRVEAESSQSRPWRIGATVWFGDFYEGRLTQLETSVSWTTLGGRLRLELDHETDTGSLPQGDFVKRVERLKTAYFPSPYVVLSSLVQYDSESSCFQHSPGTSRSDEMSDSRPMVRGVRPPRPRMAVGTGAPGTAVATGDVTDRRGATRYG